MQYTPYRVIDIGEECYTQSVSHGMKVLEDESWKVEAQNMAVMVFCQVQSTAVKLQISMHSIMHDGVLQLVEVWRRG